MCVWFWAKFTRIFTLYKFVSFFKYHLGNKHLSILLALKDMRYKASEEPSNPINSFKSVCLASLLLFHVLLLECDIKVRLPENPLCAFNLIQLCQNWAKAVLISCCPCLTCYISCEQSIIRITKQRKSS